MHGIILALLAGLQNLTSRRLPLAAPPAHLGSGFSAVSRVSVSRLESTPWLPLAVMEILHTITPCWITI
jgi:hypothetical protein